MKTEIKDILTAVQHGTLSVDEALLAIKTKPFEDIGYAKVDLHRNVRQGAAGYYEKKWSGCDTHYPSFPKSR